MSEARQTWLWPSANGPLGPRAGCRRKGTARTVFAYLRAGTLAALAVLPLRAQTPQPAKEYIYLGGRVIAIESPLATTLTISPTSATFPGGGGPGTITVTAPSTLSWTATSSQPWVTITSAASGTGNATLSYSVAANSTSPERSATITFEPGTVTFTITEAALVSQPPTNVSLNPDSGSVPSGTFSFVVSSPNGYAYLDWVQMLFNYATEGAGGCFLHYARAANVLYLLSDDGGAWAGAGSLGVAGAGSIQNSQCQVNLEASSFSNSGNNLTLNVALTFNPSFIGAQGVFMRAGDLGGMSSNWQQMGTWTAYAAPCSSPPAAVSVNPSSDSGLGPITFTYTASSCNGYAYIAWVSALINNVVDGAHACSLSYNRAGNYFVLMNDANDGWAGSGAAGEQATIENSQCTLNLAGSSAVGSGNNLTVNFALTFKAAFAGAKDNYLYVTDRSNLATGWQQVGTWTVPGGSLTISPTSAAFPGGGGTGAITVTAPSTTSWTATSSQPWVTITSAAAGTGNATLSYSVAANSTGPERSATITFEPGTVAFTITQAALVSQPPTNVSLNPDSGSDPSRTFSFVVSSPNGYAYLDWVQMLFNYATEGAGGCFLHYVRATNVLYLLSDNGGAWAGSGAAGEPATIENSQCRLDLAGSSAVGSGDNLTVSFALTFKPAFTGAKNNYLYVTDRSNLATGWQQVGTWTVSSLPGNSQTIGTSYEGTGTSEANGVFTVRGAGSDIWGTSDEFEFAYRELNGDGTIVARVASRQAVYGNTKIGVMIRDGLTATAVHAMLSLYGGAGQVLFLSRAVTGGGTADQWGPTAGTPYWLKLVRQGNSLTAYGSANGNDWVQVGTPVTLTLGPVAYAGLAVSSANGANVTTAVFDNLTVSNAANDFYLTAIPDRQTLTTAGGAGLYLLAVNSVNGTTGPLSFTAEGLPPGATASFDPATAGSGATTSLRVVAPVGVPAGSYGLKVTASNGTRSRTLPLSLTVSGTVEGALPGGWTNENVGTSYAGTGTTYSNGAFTVQGAGSDIWGDWDEFQFAYRGLAGDGTLVARVASR